MGNTNLGTIKIFHGNVSILSKFRGNYIKMIILIKAKMFPFDI